VATGGQNIFCIKGATIPCVALENMPQPGVDGNFAAPKVLRCLCPLSPQFLPSPPDCRPGRSAPSLHHCLRSVSPVGRTGSRSCLHLAPSLVFRSVQIRSINFRHRGRSRSITRRHIGAAFDDPTARRSLLWKCETTRRRTNVSISQLRRRVIHRLICIQHSVIQR